MLLQLCKEEFSLKHLRLHHEEPLHFITSHWQKDHEPKLYYLIYKWLVALIFFVVFILSIIHIDDVDAPSTVKIKWLIYLTDWGFTVCTLQAVLSAVLVTLCIANPTKRHSLLLRVYKVYWVMHVVATDVAFAITILYWSLLFVPGMNVEVMNFLVHGNNSVLMLIDLFVVAHPVRMVQCCYPIMFGLCYVIFSVIYFLVGGTSSDGHDYIYPVLDWNKPGETTAICVAVVVLVGLVQGVCWVVHRFKHWVHPRVESAGVVATLKNPVL